MELAWIATSDQSLLYERTGLSVDKREVLKRSREGMPYSMEEIIRDSYVPEFTGFQSQNTYLESDLEKVLLDHLQNFLCADYKKSRVQYATAGMDQNLFVSRYLISLPKPEELQELLEKDRTFLMQPTAEGEDMIHKYVLGVPCTRRDA